MNVLKESRRLDIGVSIVVFPFASPATFHYAYKLVKVVSSVVRSVQVISSGFPQTWDNLGNVELVDLAFRMHRIADAQPRWLSLVWWLAKMTWFQVSVSAYLVRTRNAYDTVLCAQGWYHQLPILAARAANKSVLCTVLGDVRTRAEKSYGPAVATLCELLARFNFSLSHVIVAESVCILRHSAFLRRFSSKVIEAPVYVDQSVFCEVEPIAARSEIIGFVGRLVPEKGFTEFVDAIPRILSWNPDARFIIVGDGPLRDEIRELRELGVTNDQLHWAGWVPNIKMAGYLNKLKVMVLPSYTEGLPNSILEAMACGTPVVASGVGGIPDLIREGETGFLIDSNDANSIAATVRNALACPSLARISENAKCLVDLEYSFEASMRKYLRLFELFDPRGNAK